MRVAARHGSARSGPARRRPRSSAGALEPTGSNCPSGRLVGDELDRAHEPGDAHVADERMVGQRRAAVRSNTRHHRAHVTEQIALVHQLMRRSATAAATGWPEYVAPWANVPTSSLPFSIAS